MRHLVHENDEALRDMWENLNANPNPEMMAAFEEVLAKLTGDLHKKSAERADLESTLKRRNKTQEEHLQHLYEEMEQQIQKERKAIRAEEELKEQRTRKEMEAVLEMKDAQLCNLLEKQKLLQSQLEEVKGQVPEIKEENIHLVNEKINLEKEVERQRLLMLELQDQLDALRTQTQNERRSRANAAFKMSENIAMEREDLVKELDLLRTLNTKMLDEKDCKELNQMKMKPPDSLPVDPCYTQWRSLDNALHNQDEAGHLGKCTSLKPLSPQEEKIILMESQGEDLRRLRQMKPIVNNEQGLEEDPTETSKHKILSSSSHSYPLQTHKRRRHKAYRQSSNDNVSLYEELALSNSIEEDSSMPLPELSLDHVMDSDDDGEDTETSLSQVCSIWAFFSASRRGKLHASRTKNVIGVKGS